MARVPALSHLSAPCSLYSAVLALADQIDDEGTNALMSDYVREQEKLAWMYSAFLNK